MSSHTNDLHDRIRARTGTAVLATASVFAVMIFCDRMDMKLVSLPPLWYSSRSSHLVLCVIMFVVAAILLKSPPSQVRRSPQPLFRTCRLLTREHCHLCDEALAILMRFQDALPPIEIVDIDNDPLLIRQFGESVPVVEIDGQVRFRGAVDPVLFQRLIDAAELRSSMLEIDPPDNKPMIGFTAKTGPM
jgi:hypothetical protein